MWTTSASTPPNARCTARTTTSALGCRSAPTPALASCRPPARATGTAQGEYDNPGIRAQDIGFEYGGRVQIDGSTFGAHHDRSPQACGDPDSVARDVVFTYTADIAHALEARIFGGFDHNLYVRRADCIDGPEVACAEGDLELIGLAPGTYFILVDGLTSEQQGGFTLQVTFLPHDDFGCFQDDGGTCESALEIELTEVRAGLFGADFVGNNGGCADSETPPDGCGQPRERGVDTVYYFDLPVAASVDIITDTVFDEVTYLRRADDAAGCAVAAELECADNDPARIESHDPLPAGRYYLVVDAEFADARLGPVTIAIQARSVRELPAPNDSCGLVVDNHLELVWALANPDSGAPALPVECLDGDSARSLVRCGLLDPLLAEDDGRIVFGGDTWSVGADHDVRPHDPDDPTTCEADGGLRSAGDSPDVAYRFTVDRPSQLQAMFNNIDLGNGVLALRPADDQGGCGGMDATSELACGDEPPSLDIARLDPGAYYLIVTGFNDAAAGQFTVDMRLTELP